MQNIYVGRGRGGSMPDPAHSRFVRVFFFCIFSLLICFGNSSFFLSFSLFWFVFGLPLFGFCCYYLRLLLVLLFQFSLALMLIFCVDTTRSTAELFATAEFARPLYVCIAHIHVRRDGAATDHPPLCAAACWSQHDIILPARAPLSQDLKALWPAYSPP